MPEDNTLEDKGTEKDICPRYKQNSLYLYHQSDVIEQVSENFTFLSHSRNRRLHFPLLLEEDHSNNHSGNIEHVSRNFTPSPVPVREDFTSLSSWKRITLMFTLVMHSTCQETSLPSTVPVGEDRTSLSSWKEVMVMEEMCQETSLPSTVPGEEGFVYLSF